MKKLSYAVLAGLVLAATGPIVANAAAPKTKAACEKSTKMKWDDATSKCVKK